MKPRFALLAAAALLALCLATWLVKNRMERTVRVQIGNVLRATLTSSVLDVQVWADGARLAVEAATRDERVQSALDRCKTTRACDELGAALEPFARAGSLSHIRALGLHGEQLAHAPRRAARDQGKLAPSLLHELAQLTSSKAPPIAYRPHGPSLLIGAAVRDANGEHSATLIAQRPFATLSAQLEQTRVGTTGETYAFDAHGRMVTASRFVAAQANSGRFLTLHVPGRSSNGKPELTRAVSAALAGRASVDVVGYPDYRGIPVVGAWRFLPELQLGVVTEVDTADAYRTLQTLEDLALGFALGLGVMSFVSIALLISAQRLRREAVQRAARFGQYHVERKLGEGGMGAVYLASHALLKRQAAIKLLREGRGSPEALAAFEREVQITSTLTHPNTVSIYDYGRTEEGTFYYVMEYLEGLDLQRLVELFGPLPQARVLNFLRQLCGSLSEAHAAGIVHRDIKPANLLACTRGGVADVLKVLDFGIAHVALQGGDTIARGTPEYMAPELFESSANASAQSDLYSLGLVAYFLLTGAPPFSGGATTEICHAHLTLAPEALTTVLGEPCDPVLDVAIAACLKKQPSQRPSSAVALDAMLERSALAHAWTASDAEAWWQAHRDALDAHRASSVPEAAQVSGRRAVIVGRSSALD
jgi:hypothetical protein